MVFVAFVLNDQSTEATWKIRAKSTHAPSQAWLLGSWVGEMVELKRRIASCRETCTEILYFFSLLLNPTAIVLTSWM